MSSLRGNRGRKTEVQMLSFSKHVVSELCFNRYLFYFAYFLAVNLPREEVGDLQKLFGHGPGQPAIGVPA